MCFSPLACQGFRLSHRRTLIWCGEEANQLPCRASWGLRPRDAGRALPERLSSAQLRAKAQIGAVGAALGSMHHWRCMGAMGPGKGVDPQAHTSVSVLCGDSNPCPNPLSPQGEGLPGGRGLPLFSWDTAGPRSLPPLLLWPRSDIPTLHSYSD